MLPRHNITDNSNRNDEAWHEEVRGYFQQLLERTGKLDRFVTLSLTHSGTPTDLLYYGYGDPSDPFYHSRDNWSSLNFAIFDAKLAATKKWMAEERTRCWALNPANHGVDQAAAAAARLAPAPPHLQCHKTVKGILSETTESSPAKRALRAYRGPRGSGSPMDIDTLPKPKSPKDVEMRDASPPPPPLPSPWRGLMRTTDPATMERLLDFLWGPFWKQTLQKYWVWGAAPVQIAVPRWAGGDDGDADADVDDGEEDDYREHMVVDP
jgi:hypothetical protein